MSDEALLRHQLATPPGRPGSGRLRYAAAVALHRMGRLDAAALEAFRGFASLDGHAPEGAPGATDLSPAERRDRLLEEVGRLLARLRGPGVAEARKGLALAGRPGEAPAPPAPAIVAALLPDAVAAMGPGDLADALAEAAPVLAWAEERDGAAATLGPPGLGLLLQPPGARVALGPGLAVPLTGPHAWRRAPGAPAVTRPALRPAWIEPGEEALVEVGDAPFLALRG